jgi:diacylglycerol kinase (ATP)
MASILDKILHRETPDARVVFNPSSGDPEQSETQLDQVLTTLRSLGLKTKVTRVGPRSRIHHITARAAKRGVPFVVACGGDNTIDLAARGISGTQTTLVIVPTGTRNNIARSLNLPQDIVSATHLISTGKRSQVDVGRVQVAGRETVFLELMTIGLGAAMFPSMDAAQKGDLARLGDLLGTFISHSPSIFHLNLDEGRQEIHLEALMLLALNMPYLGANFQIASSVDYTDGLLDVFVYADLGKLDLLTHALQVAQGFTDDLRVRHMRVKQLEVHTDPPMPVMLDGTVFSEKLLRHRSMILSSAPRMLNVMTVPET